VNMLSPERLDSGRLLHRLHGEKTNLYMEIDQFRA
jgi:hypothetical protein